MTTAEQKENTGLGADLKRWLLPGLFTILVVSSLAILGSLAVLHPGMVLNEAPTALTDSAKLADNAAEKITTAYIKPAEASVKPPAAEITDQAVLSPPAGNKPKLAIIIDDMGYRQQTGDKMLGLPLNLTFSFLPFGPHTTELSRKALALKRDILLHLPLEPTDPKWKLGQGMLFLAMSTEEIEKNFSADLAQVPMAVGVNNHMGSLFTENTQAMEKLLRVLEKKDLFFVDSITTPKTVGGELASAMGIKTASRRIFLDNELDEEKIIRQLEKLVTQAEKNGAAVGIGHPFPTTLKALRDFQDQLNDRVEIVGVHELVH